MLEKNSDREVHVEKVEQRPMGSIAFGLERIGLIAVSGADRVLHHSRRADPSARSSASSGSRSTIH